jgi:hypothetical protein
MRPSDSIVLGLGAGATPRAASALRSLAPRLALAILVLVLGCSGGGKKDSSEPNGGGGGEGGGGRGGGGPVTLVSVNADGGSCVAVVRDAGGAESTHPASDSLCPGGSMDASSLVGKQVKLDMGAAPAPESTLPSGEDPCRDIAPPCGGESGGGPAIVVGISAAS